MKKKLISIFIVMAMGLLIAVPVFAKPYATYDSPQNHTDVYREDITGDGIPDIIEVVPKRDSYRIVKIVIMVNGKTAYVKKPSLPVYGTRLEVVHMTNAKQFVFFRTTGDSNYPENQVLLKYDNARKKLVKVLDLSKYTGQVCHVSGVTKNAFTILYKARSSVIGKNAFNLKYVYNSRTGSFILASNTPKVKSLLSDKTAVMFGIKGTRYYKNQFKTLKTIQAYSNKACTKKAVKIPKGKWLILKKLFVTKNAEKDTAIYAVQFKYKNKTYWVRNDYSNLNCLLGVSQQGMWGGSAAD